MFCTQSLLVFVTLYMGMVHSWDVATSTGDDLLSFYTNETLTSTITIEFRKIFALTFDEVHNMMLYVDKQANNDKICGYDLSSAENKCFIQGNGRNIHDLAFDPVTERVFFTDTNDRSVNWISLKPESEKNINLLMKIDNGTPRDIVVDSCEGYIYWLNTYLTKPTIQRARLNGTERDVFATLKTVPVNATYNLEPNSLAIDQPLRRLYWLEPETTNEYRLFVGNLNRKQKPVFVIHIYTPKFFKVPANTLTVSKNAVLNAEYAYSMNSVYSFPSKKFDKTALKRVYSRNKTTISIVANFKIKDQIQDCEALSQVKLATEYDGPFCVHGMRVTDQSSCKCTPGYTGERCDVSLCENFCLKGNCSISDEGLPECRCEAGYTGPRCEVNKCYGYCLNNGECILNEEDEPSCQCVEGYEGIRCEVAGSSDGSDTVTILVKQRDKSSTFSCRQTNQTDL